jgi:hypothetical protein
MALKERRWIWGPVLAAMVAAILALPPRIPGDRGLLAFLGLFSSPWEYPPGTAFRESVKSAVRAQLRRHEEAALADSVLQVARGPKALHSNDGFVTVTYETPLTADSARVWLRAASGELALYPKVTSRGLPVVVALMSDPARSRASGPRYFGFPTLGLQGAAPSTGACVIAVNLYGRAAFWTLHPVAHDASGHPVGRLLDSCVLYSRFGLPGVAVSQWVGRGPNWFWFRNDQLAFRMQELQRPPKPENIARPEALSQGWWGDNPWREVGCLRGVLPLCVRAAGLEGAIGRFPGSYYFTRGQLVAHLLATGTPAQFAAFWQSPLPPAEALARAYGRPAGELARSAFSRWYSASTPGGPRAGGRLVLAGLAWAGVALVVAVFAGRRRQIEV